MPKPARIGRKARKGIVEEASLDIMQVSEDFHDCLTLAQLVAAKEKVDAYIAFVRELDAGELTDYDTVDRAQKLIAREEERIEGELGRVCVLLEKGGTDKVKRREHKAEIGAGTKQLKRLRNAWLECSRWRSDYFEEQRDREAAERLEGVIAS